MTLKPPFVLLDDARTGRAQLYRDPVEIITTTHAAEVPSCLDALRRATKDRSAAGYFAYEAGHALQPRLPAPDTGLPLLWFGLFEQVEEVEMERLLPAAAGGWCGAPRAATTPAAYRAAFDRVQALIEAGDIYQANLTIRAEVATAGHPLALYAGLRQRAAAGYGAVVATGSSWLLSLSPELFFELRDGRVTTRPMKGTAQSKGDARTRAEQARALAADPKQRAENLMIVDLLRNDLSRVARPGSVRVPALFEVEEYPTVLQMTSTVTADLADVATAVDVLEALFPCGSITGAPKRRAMEIIAEVETDARGPYTGAIGAIGPGGTEAAFNVAIRTLELPQNESRARLGLGSGVVADSQAEAEWRECLAKGAFVTDQRRFDLIETMAFDPQVGIARLDAHLARMRASAALFDFPFDRHRARNELQAATFRLRAPAKIRLLLSAQGSLAIEARDLPPPPAAPVDVVVRPLAVSADDFRLRHKTSDRAFYDRGDDPGFETIYVNAHGQVTEGSFTTVFVERDGLLLTPPLAAGLLPGILRQELLDAGRAREEALSVHDLDRGLLIGNSVRGLLPARLLPL